MEWIIGGLIVWGALAAIGAACGGNGIGNDPYH